MVDVEKGKTLAKLIEKHFKPIVHREFIPDSWALKPRFTFLLFFYCYFMAPF